MEIKESRHIAREERERNWPMGQCLYWGPGYHPHRFSRKVFQAMLWLRGSAVTYLHIPRGVWESTGPVKKVVSSYPKGKWSPSLIYSRHLGKHFWRTRERGSVELKTAQGYLSHASEMRKLNLHLKWRGGIQLNGRALLLPVCMHAPPAWQV
jgi:hypothetical protein